MLVAIAIFAFPVALIVALAVRCELKHRAFKRAMDAAQPDAPVSPWTKHLEQLEQGV